MGRVGFPVLLIALALAGCGGDDNGSGPTTPTPTPSPTPSPSPTGGSGEQPAQVTVTYLHTFQTEPIDGGQPNGPLLQASDGNFYGTTRAGGVNLCRSPDNVPCGTIFRLTPTGDETVLYSFGASASDGYTPTAPLIQGNDGALYGMTANGGEHGGGTVFKITLDSIYTVLHSFGGTSSDGVVPIGGLVQASDGDFYGATVSGGANHCDVIPQSGGNCGTIFKISSDGEKTVLYSFGSSPADGVQPTGSLLQASDGNFYGTTTSGGANLCGLSGTRICGTVFKMTPAGILTILHSFGASPNDGIAPQGPLIQAADGAFYGTTPSGGASQLCNPTGCGTVFKLTPAGQLTIVHSFATASKENGYGPAPFLIQARDGNLYGTTHSGGAVPSDLNGTVFRLTPSGVLTVLYSFGPVNEKAHDPLGGVIQGDDGAFYGVTGYSGAAGGSGTVFKLVVR